MILRKNISLNEDYLKKLEPLMEKHNGNLSAVIREVIDLADAAFQDPDSVKRLISGLKKEQNLTSATLVWSLKNLGGRIPETEVIENVIGTEVYSISSLQKRLNELGAEIYWGSSIKVETDDDMRPTNVVFMISGNNMDMNRFFAGIIAVSVLNQFNLGIQKVQVIENSFRMELERTDKAVAQKCLNEKLGYMNSVFSEIYTKPDFWNILINLYKKMDYNMVSISKPFFEDLIGGEEMPKSTACFEKFFDSHINKISPDDFINKISVLYRSMGLIEEINLDNDSLIIKHGLSDSKGIEKLSNIFVELLRLNGHTYYSEVNENLIVLKHVPEMGKLFIKTLDDLSHKDMPFKDFTSGFQKMLPLLEKIPFDEKIITSFGSNFGEIMIQNYENENNIIDWNSGLFREFLKEVVSVCKLDVKWNVVNEGFLEGKVNSCPAYEKDGIINIAMCTFIKGIMGGCTRKAFGENVELIHKTCTDNGENTGICDVYIAL